MNTRRIALNFELLDNPEYLEPSDVLRVVKKEDENVSKFHFKNMLCSLPEDGAHFLWGVRRNFEVFSRWHHQQSACLPV